ncbi:DUF389 domain-containing protein [Pontibacter silvestris]|uniref:DUF389 domain-containing protein n=1 Tax=Pontibacter silvestris TaxID=2305183 RepID=A0ABW4WRI5_9BACT|nr:DUF389 domain-containing protein [Pontibacter silvestris]MCC9138583.1 DUF389 domain-containing protein [Pontibacter silvestris]
MRQLTIKVPAGAGQEVIKKAEGLDGKNLSLQQTESGDLVTVYLNNKLVSNFIEQISNLEDAEISLVPRGMITLYPPRKQAPDQVTDVTYRSPIEIFLGGLQSVGSRTGLIGYAVAGGLIAWIGLYTGTSYLLVAAMLVAPFAGPAMNAALAASSGKMDLLKKSLIRYFLAIGTAVVVSFLMSFVVQQDHATPMMVDVSQISQVSILLPLVAGFAGGINLVQSERDSLVSGAAVGMLVAASLAPPTALIGMALNFGNWQLIRSGIFLLTLQLAGIQLSAALVFRFMGKVTIKGVRFAGGKEYVFKLSMIVSAIIVAGLLYWQFSKQPGLQKASLTTQITETMHTALDKEVKDVKTIEVNARFTRGTLPNKNPVICELYLLNQSDSLTDEQMKKRVEDLLRTRIKEKDYNADPMFSITMLDYDKEIE